MLGKREKSESMADIDDWLAAVRKDGKALQRAPPTSRSNKEIVLAAVKQNGDALKYASEDLQCDKEVILTAVQPYGWALKYFPNDKWRLLTGCEKNGNLLKFARKELQVDKEFVLAAVELNGNELEHASEEFQDNKEVILAAVKQNGEALKYASEKLRGDKEVVLTAVEQDGRALEHASKDLQGDKEAVLAAVQQCGEMLQYASEALQCNKEIVLAAIKQSDQAMKSVSKQLKSNKAFGIYMVKENGCWFEHVTVSPDDWKDMLEPTRKYLKEQEHHSTLHKWVNDKGMAEKLNRLVEFDSSIAYMPNSDGKNAIDVAIPSCKEKMEEALRLFGKYKVEDGAWEHLSPTACVFKVVHFDNGNAEKSAPVPMVLKCMSNFQQVKAELKCREELSNENKNVMRIRDVYVDSSAELHYGELKDNITFDETGLHLENGLEHSIRYEVAQKAVKGNDVMHQSEPKDGFTYKYVLAYDFADRTLDRAMKDDRIAGTLLAKHILKEVGNGMLELHENGRIHGDIKPPNILRVGTLWQLTDLDVSCPIGEAYGEKSPSTGWCPPEVVEKIFNKQLQSFAAKVSHDLWSFGALAYYLETGTELFQVNDRDDIVNESEIIKDWKKSSKRNRILDKVRSEEARVLLEKLLHHDPDKRLAHFNNKGDLPADQVMSAVLNDVYFSNQALLAQQIGRIHDDMKSGFHSVHEILTEIKSLTLRQELELKETRKVLLHAIYEADEVHIPTTFVILNEKLPDISQGESEQFANIPADEIINGCESLAEDDPYMLGRWNKQMNQAMEWGKHLANHDVAELMQGMDTSKVADFLEERAQKLVTGTTMYFYWVDELTGEPVRAKGFPIEITTPSEVVPKLLPYVEVGMCAMSLYCGSTGIARMFGCPTPTVPEAVRSELRVFAEILKQTSSVEAFQCVHEKVKSNDEGIERVSGAELRDLVDFVKGIKLEEKLKFAGLCRVGNKDDGGAIWTLKQKEDEFKRGLDVRCGNRRREVRTAAEELKHDQIELGRKEAELSEKDQTIAKLIAELNKEKDFHRPVRSRRFNVFKKRLKATMKGSRGQILPL